jgi:chaperonin GroES
MKVFSSIYKRIYRSLKQEFKKLYKLNGKFLEPEQYFRVLDSQEEGVVTLSDYKNDGTDVQPVADPQMATQTLMMAKNQAILQVMQHPLVSDEEALMRFFKGLDIPAPEKLIVPQEARQKGPDPELQLQAKIEASKHMQRVADVALKYASAVEKIASAEDKEAGRQIELYAMQLKRVLDQANEQGTPKQMENGPGNTGNQGPLGGGPAGLPPGGAEGIELQEPPGISDEVGAPAGV